MAEHAVALSSNDGEPWFELCKAAGFNSDSVTADKALWKALALSPERGQIYWWGMQLYQPKWYSNPAKLVQVANLAVKNAKVLDEPPTDSLVQAYHNLRMQDKLEPLLQQLVAANPRDAVAHYELGAIMHYQKRQYDEAEPLYRKAISAAPRYDRAINSLGDLQLYVHNDAKAAEKLYRQAIALKPKDGFYHANLARLLHREGRESEAQQEVQTMRSLGFRDRSHSVWGELGISP